MSRRPDGALLAALRTAARRGLDATAAERLLGCPALLNSLRAGEQSLAERVDLGLEPPERRLPRHWLALAYWALADDGGDPRVAGLVWGRSGRARLFRARVLTP
ncbi:hypothetical protein [Plasticicumulans acidivorans]|uniref:Uncharacterized protein n=1 Tax=Plasticicumulans acidivorans TaxID=886464 RepID=A0A317MTZ6_9GAMM|nr:hypothetical protein [Plasticicumulans acidivorans]PWV61188.1 hypothetical protein C7443_106202 [Plasticicumulans acidivorans]